MALFHRKKKKETNNNNEFFQAKSKSKFQQFKDTVFSRHYKIERFGIGFSVLSLAIIMCLLVSLKNYTDYVNNTVASQSLYGTQFTTSKTGIDGQVTGIYANKDRTKSFVLWKVSDYSSLPSDPKKYQFFMAAQDGRGNYQPVSGKPAAVFYLFGQTGYAGLMLINSQGFSKQILNIVCRINGQIVPSDDNNSGNMDQGMFAKYDQFRLKVNPGANKIKTLKSLDSKREPSVADLYSEMILNKNEKNIRKQLKKDVSNLAVDLNNIHDRELRLRDYDGLQVPKLPKYIAGDKVIEKNGTQYFVTKQTIPGGVDFDWQDATIQEGEIDALKKKYKMDPSLTSDEFLSDLAEKRKDNQTSENLSSKISNSTWRYKNGKKADLQDGDGGGSDDGDSNDNDESSVVSKTKQINNDIQDFTSSIDNYNTDKQNYQTVDLIKWLNLEATYRRINNFSAVNDSSNLLKIY